MMITLTRIYTAFLLGAVAADLAGAWNRPSRRPLVHPRDVGACVPTGLDVPPSDGSVGWSFIKQVPARSTSGVQDWRLAEDLIDPDNPGIDADYSYPGLVFDAKLVLSGDSTLQISKDPKKILYSDSKFVISMVNKEGGWSQRFWLSHLDKCHSKLDSQREWDELESVDIYRYK